MAHLRVAKSPSDELSLSNCAIVCDKDFDKSIKHVEIQSGPNTKYLFKVLTDPGVSPGTVAISGVHRKWACLALNQETLVRRFNFEKQIHMIGAVTLQADFLQKKSSTCEPYDTDKMKMEFIMKFPEMSLTVGQPLVFSFENKKMLQVVVQEIQTLDFKQGSKPKAVKSAFGLLSGNTGVIFEKADGSALNLTGKSKGKQTYTAVINPDWDFNKMGIGGLDNEFSAIFRRAFASRVFPPEVVQQLGMKHCRGILLYGPPGTGKTLMARQIGKMLNSREPKIINGPQVLDKFVGESEANIRKLFAEAEEEEKRLGPNSGLHIIIFDEIDAICKARGSVGGSTAVHDTVVNQLLSKIDGVDQLNNILIIGMTNRKDMIDDALLRPGRLEVQMEISLPDEKGRMQILTIHTCRMKEHNKISADVILEELAANTKNFSGAEIEGLVRAATSTAMNRLIKASSKVEIDPEASEKLQVTRLDFLHALEHDVKPAFGVSEDELAQYAQNGIIHWGTPVADVLEEGQLVVSQTANSERTSLVTLLLSGPANSGKTALAAHIAKESNFPFLKLCSAGSMIGFHENAKCLAIKKVFEDAYKSTLSCIVLDGIERLLDYVSIGPRFSNHVLQALLVLLTKLPPPGRRLLVIGTTSQKEILQEMGILSAFSACVHVSNISTSEHLMCALEELNSFSKQTLEKIKRNVNGRRFSLGIKKLVMLVERACQTEEENHSAKFLDLLHEEASLEYR